MGNRSNSEHKAISKNIKQIEKTHSAKLIEIIARSKEITARSSEDHIEIEGIRKGEVLRTASKDNKQRPEEYLVFEGLREKKEENWLGQYLVLGILSPQILFNNKN